MGKGLRLYQVEVPAQLGTNSVCENDRKLVLDCANYE